MTNAEKKARRIYAKLGHRIYRARIRANLSQAELAVMVGLTRTSITNMEAGRQRMLPHTLVEISEACECKALLRVA